MVNFVKISNHVTKLFHNVLIYNLVKLILQNQHIYVCVKIMELLGIRIVKKKYQSFQSIINVRICEKFIFLLFILSFYFFLKRIVIMMIILQ